MYSVRNDSLACSGLHQTAFEPRRCLHPSGSSRTPGMIKCHQVLGARGGTMHRTKRGAGGEGSRMLGTWEAFAEDLTPGRSSENEAGGRGRRGPSGGGHRAGCSPACGRHCHSSLQRLAGEEKHSSGHRGSWLALLTCSPGRSPSLYPHCHISEEPFGFHIL